MSVAPGYPDHGEPSAEGKTATDLGWRAFFTDPRLQTLIATALERNRDLAQAYARIEQARAQYNIQENQRLPEMEVGGSVRQAHQPVFESTGIEVSQVAVNAGVSAFELDLWGRVRNLAEADRQRYLASVDGARAFRLSLIAQVASTYFAIRGGEERIALAERSMEGRREGVHIARLNADAGITSTVDYNQALLLLTQTQTELADVRRITEQARNLLEVLVGGPVAETLPTGAPLERQLQLINPGLPSALLADRPDIQAAEHALLAANADIGAARAAFFPTISLTGDYGLASTALHNLFTGPSQSWSFGGLVSLPIFDWERREAQLKLSKARADELVAAYQGAVQTAFREVSDYLIGRQRYAEQIAAQTLTLDTQRDLARAAHLRYENGISIYLEVLDAERNLFTAEQQLIQLRTLELQNAVNLYIALGGGETGANETPP